MWNEKSIFHGNVLGRNEIFPDYEFDSEFTYCSHPMKLFHIVKTNREKDALPETRIIESAWETFEMVLEQ